MPLTFDINETLGHLLRLFIAFALALPIAWDREQRERSAGLRTFTIVAISTCGIFISARGALGDTIDAQSRVWQGVLAGIGFIGSGAILKTKDGVRGTATAASIWNTAAVGASVAYDALDIAVALSVVNFAVLRWLAPLKAESRGRRHDDTPSGPTALDSVVDDDE